MPDITFFLDGEDARGHGINLQAPVTVSGIEPDVRNIPIDGRNGDLLRWTGAYKNRTGRARCFALQMQADVAVAEACGWLLSNPGYRRLELPDDPGHFYMARVVSGAQTAIRMQALAPFDLRFDMMPQRFVSNPKTIILRPPDSDDTVYSSHSGTSRPLLRLIGTSTNSGRVSINGRVIQVNKFFQAQKNLFVDCESMEAYYIQDGEKVNQDSNIRCDEFPELHPGENKFVSSGLDALYIEPRWWDL